ncbi:MAG: hypothetical protein ACPL25_05520 [Ignavibacteria bacterium]
MRFLFVLFFPLLILNQVDLKGDKNFDYDSYKRSIEYVLIKYPESTLIDLYKYFYQGRFGPEHFIKDSLIALKFLQNELESEEISSYKSKPDSFLIELLLPEKKFVRIDLSLVKDRIILPNLLFTAFLQSASKYDSIDYENWKKDWNEILSLIQNEKIKVKNFNEDKNRIENALKQNKLVFSHSTHYKNIYKPHYRVIDYKIFKTFLLPLIKQYRIKFSEPE